MPEIERLDASDAKEKLKRRKQKMKEAKGDKQSLIQEDTESEESENGETESEEPQMMVNPGEALRDRRRSAESNSEGNEPTDYSETENEGSQEVFLQKRPLISKHTKAH
eukprot:GHVN01010326.1.p2 GENE.GHVN01010326.1~~GHVN01010326.1.p2  ORF type:complete len:109 (+),score=23.68 GHVN01010326.1:2-328(+)